MRDRMKSSSVRRIAACAAVSLASLASVACTPLRYVTQAAAGQEQLNVRGISIDEIVTHGYLDAPTRRLLAHVPAIKAFAEQNGLARTKNYERYVWLDRPAVVWVVSACDPVAFRPKTWSFPVIGSITYTGWFDRGEATVYGSELAGEGWDVDVRPSPAYSTLGWFDDPVLSTMIDRSAQGLGDLAETIFHEMLHATFYVVGQSTLNESVASFVGDGLARRYLDATVGETSVEKQAYVAMRAGDEAKDEAMRRAYVALDGIYRSNASRAEKLQEKTRIVSALSADVGASRPITNATLIQYATYGSGKKELTDLLASCGGSFPRMLRSLERVRAAAKTEPEHGDPGALLRPLLATPCPS